MPHKAILKAVYGTEYNPIGLDLVSSEGWDSNWYGGNDYGDKHRRSQNQSISMLVYQN
jgi:hypothetical protein